MVNTLDYVRQRQDYINKQEDQINKLDKQNIDDNKSINNNQTTKKSDINEANENEYYIKKERILIITASPNLILQLETS